MTRGQTGGRITRGETQEAKSLETKRVAESPGCETKEAESLLAEGEGVVRSSEMKHVLNH